MLMQLLVMSPLILVAFAIGIYVSPLVRAIDMSAIQAQAVHIGHMLMSIIRPAPRYRGRHWVTV